MLRLRLTAFACAGLAGAGAIFAGALLNDGVLRAGNVLVDWAVMQWSGDQIAAFMEYAGPLSLLLLALGLILLCGTSMQAKKP